MDDLKSAIEAVLFASGDSVPVGRLSLAFGCEEEEIICAAKDLEDELASAGRGIRLVFLEDRLQLCSAPEFAPQIIKALDERKKPTLTKPALEVLAIVAYYQPVTRAYIDQMRGVDSSYTVGVLLERGLIEVSGKLDAPGRPSLFKTTESFLRNTGLSSIEELPILPDMTVSDSTEKLRQRVEELRSAVDKDQITISEISV